jgi:hypothetical protein
MAGTGGTFGGGELGDVVPLPGPGDGLLNVRSVIEPLLFVLCSPPRPVLPRVPGPLPFDEADPRRTIRFVCILPTDSGEAVCERKAAAAAAEEREGVDPDVWRKAEVAAAVAFWEVLRSMGYTNINTLFPTLYYFDFIRTGLAELPRRRENIPGMKSTARPDTGTTTRIRVA